MKLTEGWGEAKNYSKGEDDGFKMEEGEGEGRGKIRLHAAVVRLPNPFTEWTGALIGAVGCILIATCPSPAFPSPPPLVHFLLAFKMAA